MQCLLYTTNLEDNIPIMHNIIGSSKGMEQLPLKNQMNYVIFIQRHSFMYHHVEKMPKSSSRYHYSFFRSTSSQPMYLFLSLMLTYSALGKVLSRNCTSELYKATTPNKIEG